MFYGFRLFALIFVLLIKLMGTVVRKVHLKLTVSIKAEMKGNLNQNR